MHVAGSSGSTGEDLGTERGGARLDVHVQLAGGVMNRKPFKAFDLAIPPSLLQRADQVIE